jgi:hypothetical protein
VEFCSDIKEAALYKQKSAPQYLNIYRRLPHLSWFALDGICGKDCCNHIRTEL